MVVRGLGFKGMCAAWGFCGLCAWLGTSGCSSSDGGSAGSGYCATYASRARECGVLGAGRITCVDYHDAAEVCETKCLREATCASLVPYVCGTLGSDALSTCVAECSGEPPVTCTDGQTLPGFDRCDGSSQCEDGSDEAGCKATGSKCRNVDEYYPTAKRCDGVKDCSDGSDELPDCAPFVCKSDGTKLSFYAECDGHTDCADGSDEPADCAPRVCGAN